MKGRRLFVLEKRLSKYFLIWVLLMGMMAEGATAVRAEFVIDLYGGLAITENSEVEGLKATVPFSGMGPVTTEKFKTDANFKDSFTVGGRLTYWTQRFPWLGVAFDGSYFKAEAKNANIEIPVYGFSLLMMMRYPLFPNEQFPQGRLQPYLGVGPEFAFGKAKAEFEDNGVKTKIKDNDGGVGVDLRTGILWPLNPHWGIFTEYRFTYLDFDQEDTKDFEPLDPSSPPEGTYKYKDLETKLTTHHFLVGISFRF